MLRSQATALAEQAESLLERTRVSTKSSEIETLTELALRCFAESREILSKMKINSTFYFLECSAHLGRARIDYPSYLDFCARNGLEILAEVDFQLILSEALPEDPPDAPTVP